LKISLLIPALICICINAFAQTDATATTLNNIQRLPAFKIFTVPDSTAFTNEQLKKNKPLVLMFFSPDCDHCQKETKEILAYKEELKNLQIIMASPVASFGEIKNFYQEYNITSMKNIIMGQDPNYALCSRYHLRTYPSVYIYDAKGNLAKAFVGNVSVPTILDALK
jgi:thiol-disulfide isomerase/thioredoxin